MKTHWLILYVVSAVTVILGLLLDVLPMYWIAKPLLMIALGLHFLQAVNGNPAWKKTVLLALLFSWGGDVFLISADYFVHGLVSFLVAHIFYIVAYHQTGAAEGTLKPLDIIKFSAYGVVLMAIIYPGLGNLLIPVFLYAAVLLAMGIWSHKRRGGTSDKSFVLVASGAMLFCLSDGMIAINKFAFVIPAERIVDMTIYMTAQYLIIQGLIHHPERS